nr:SPOR domain-containing protein [Sneathiella limimaris]
MVEKTEEKAVETVEKKAEETAQKTEAAPKPVAEAAPKTQPTEAKEAPAGVAFRVQLGAFRSEDAAKKAWRDLQKKHEGLLAGEVYKIQTAEVTGKGLFYRLQAGAFEDRSKAAELCDQLKARKQDCLIAKN